MLRLRTDLDAAHAGSSGRARRLDFALDWFDALGAGEEADREALVMVEEERAPDPAAPTPSSAGARPSSPRGCAARGCSAGGQGDPHARQPGGAVGDRARVHQAGRTHDPHHRDARGERPPGPRGARRRLVGGHLHSNALKFADIPGTHDHPGPGSAGPPRASASGPSPPPADDDAAGRPGPGASGGTASSTCRRGHLLGHDVGGMPRAPWTVRVVRKAAQRRRSPGVRNWRRSGEHRVLDYPRSFNRPER
ncbi:hypothetical protein QJS66_16160 [Kocuria rhizophila]|nr:hypothetical protein QJS66_16160 [Kocuria rhizophila]